SVTDDSDSATDDSDSATDDSDSVTDDSDSATDDSDSVTDDSDSSFEDDVEPLEKRDCGSLEDVYPGGNMTFRLNHLGFDADGGKEIVIETSDALDSFQVVDENQKVAACGELVSVYFNEWGGGPNYYVAEFSYLQTPGTYRILAGGTYSEAFVIEENLLFGETVSDVLSCFYLSRADHPNVVNADTQTPKYGSGGKIDVHGGWYDASGDISKYLSHLSYANFLNPQQIPLVVWALAYAHNEASAHLNRLGKSDAVLAEALYGADYLVRILDPAGYFYMNVFDNWTGDLNQREICAFEGEDGYKTSEYQAAFREGGGMTIAALARVSTFGQNGDFTPSDYLWAAKTGFDHLEANGPNYCDDGKENIIDDYTALLAATELFKATFDPNYLDAARARAINLSQRLSADGYFIADDGNRPFWHASDAGLPVVALARYASVETDDVYRSEALNTIETHMAWQLTLTNAQANPYGYARQTFHSGGTVQDGFFIPHDNETNYWWQGENARLASLAAAFVIGGRAIGQKGHYHGVTKSDAIFAANQVDWILGKNPYDICFMKGFGRNNPPAYQGEKTEFGQRAHDGGISNGITGKQTNGAGIQWNPNPPRDEWGNQMWWLQWRWVEQWLPHATWYLIATAAMTQE
ncbi:MAG: glycoside hydrolase family 9 protein, partial [Deltaproteobacteria bacterium]|nr:glycoside hydrolase family 9 protein [Deltaproteobacteria bacterium]